ncbi:SMP-30/gluconolactonase/LRE family protein [Pedobacter sp.]|uniref:SMP-30/gluconolactonase/LRE family protein n=1 Tax=Pedobacter sp. TaxID=1411316 RepID=UPI003BAAAD7F
MKFFSSILFITLTSFTLSKAQSLQQIWKSEEKLPVPESVLYDAKSKTLFVSLIDGEPGKKDGKGGIAVLNLDGSLKNAEWISGLNAPKGMGIYKNVLYVADIDKVLAIDIPKAKIIFSTQVPDAVFLNDITVDNKGNIYVSDTRTNKIHLISNGKSELYLENVTAANGLKYSGSELYVLAGTELIKFNSKKERIVIATGLEKPGDGLELLPNGDFIVSCWAGIIYHIKADGTKTKILDVQGKMNTADIGYDDKSKTVYVPTFNANSVISYKLF